MLQGRQRRESPVRDRCRLLEAQRSRLVGDSRALRYADELGVCPEPVPTRAEDMIPDREPAHGRADRSHFSRKVAAGQSLFRSQESRTEETPEKGLRSANVAVGPVDRRRMDPDEDLVVPRGGALDVLES